MSTKSFGEKIKELREGMHLTQEQLADKMGYKKSMISYYEQQQSESSVSLKAIIMYQ